MRAKRTKRKTPANYSYRNAHNSMKQRCYNSKNCGYRYCGRLGVTVYRPWHDYKKWLADVLNEIGPHPDDMVFTLKDRAGNYEPGNICWATRREATASDRIARAHQHNQKEKLA